MSNKLLSNPYIVGNPIKTKEMFFGREDDFTFVSRKLQSEKPNQVIVFCGERRSGKTSILFQIINGRLGEGFLPILIDMQILAGIRSDKEFYKAILDIGLEQIKLNEKEIAKLNQDIHTEVEESFSKFIEYCNLKYPQKMILILLDEYELLETKIKEGTLSENIVHFFAGLLESKLHISFIFTGSTNLENRKVDFWKVLLGKSIYRKISYLSEEDTKKLITEPVAPFIIYPIEIVSAIYRLSGGQPFFTQVICQNLVDLFIEEERYEPKLQDLEKIVKDIVENPLPQMIYSWNSLTDWSKFTLSSLAASLDNSSALNKSSEIFRYLLKNKIVLPFKKERLNIFLEEAYQKEFLLKNEENAYCFRMDLFRRWIKKEHSIWKVIKEVNLEVKRQSIFLRYSLIGALGLIIISLGLTFFLLNKPNELLKDNFTPHQLDQKTEAAAKDNKLENIKVKANYGPFRLTVDNTIKLTSEGEKNPLIITLPPIDVGLHKFKANNVLTNEEIVFDEVLTTETKELSINFKKKAEEYLFGSLFISTQPGEASIYIDDKPYGKTPQIIDNLKIGEHKIRLSKEGYKNLIYSINIEKNKRTELQFNLEIAYGKLVLDIRPTAQIYLDGQFLVETPIVKPLDIQAGKHQLRIENSKLGVNEELTFEIKENEIFKIEREYK